MQNQRARNNRPHTTPTQLDDGSIKAIVTQVSYSIGRHRFLELVAPQSIAGSSLAGRFIMARCAEPPAGECRTDWSIYLRRPLFVSAARTATHIADATTLTVSLPDVEDVGYEWLSRREPDESVNLLGPFGRGLALAANARHLLLITTPECAPMLLIAADEMLDKGGRVTVMVRAEEVDEGLLKLFPLAVEIQTAANEEWRDAVGEALKWADSVLIADPAYSPQVWADLLRRHRLRLDDDYASIYVPSDVLCCTGACMACVVERTNGSLTRACVHGPFFPLTSLVE